MHIYENDLIGVLNGIPYKQNTSALSHTRKLSARFSGMLKTFFIILFIGKQTWGDIMHT